LGMRGVSFLSCFAGAGGTISGAAKNYETLLAQMGLRFPMITSKRISNHRLR
jgi:hypothetical protein